MNPAPLLSSFTATATSTLTSTSTIKHQHRQPLLLTRIPHLFSLPSHQLSSTSHRQSKSTSISTTTFAHTIFITARTIFRGISTAQTSRKHISCFVMDHQSKSLPVPVVICIVLLLMIGMMIVLPLMCVRGKAHERPNYAVASVTDMFNSGGVDGETSEDWGEEPPADRGTQVALVQVVYDTPNSDVNGEASEPVGEETNAEEGTQAALVSDTPNSEVYGETSEDVEETTADEGT